MQVSPFQQSVFREPKTIFCLCRFLIVTVCKFKTLPADGPSTSSNFSFLMTTPFSKSSAVLLIESIHQERCFRSGARLQDIGKPIIRVGQGIRSDFYSAFTIRVFKDFSHDRLWEEDRRRQIYSPKTSIYLHIQKIKPSGSDINVWSSGGLPVVRREEWCGRDQDCEHQNIAGLF